MEKELKQLPTRQFGVEKIGETFIVREGSPAGVVVHVCGSYKDVDAFFASL